ncbi:prepilin-type N-terminal cleavage/methylation domain-containing protein [Candidatus Sumerlaeota bacterium]|nr:prepilin-type N-terminal cleavage/methylation domain-containing protein [Candidatus Sumerlaeota bacterium]
MRGQKKAFTLIELLIVVLIIAILAAIAVPNFLEFQTRAKVSRVKADIRSLLTALEAYRVDTNFYPPVDNSFAGSGSQMNRGGVCNVHSLSTPIAYISNTLSYIDPFARDPDFDTDIPYLRYMNVEQYRLESGWDVMDAPGYHLLSRGPDTVFGPHTSVLGLPTVCNANLQMAYGGCINDPPQNYDYFLTISTYDPSNGTVSEGDIHRYAGTSGE